jgi:hypothetical protein
MVSVQMASDKPTEPPHDMEVRISFVKDAGSPSRIFLAATDMNPSSGGNGPRLDPINQLTN